MQILKEDSKENSLEDSGIPAHLKDNALCIPDPACFLWWYSTTARALLSQEAALTPFNKGITSSLSAGLSVNQPVN